MGYFRFAQVSGIRRCACPCRRRSSAAACALSSWLLCLLVVAAEWLLEPGTECSSHRPSSAHACICTAAPKASYRLALDDESPSVCTPVRKKLSTSCWYVMVPPLCMLAYADARLHAPTQWASVYFRPAGVQDYAHGEQFSWDAPSWTGQSIAHEPQRLVGQVLVILQAPDHEQVLMFKGLTAQAWYGTCPAVKNGSSEQRSGAVL